MTSITKLEMAFKAALSQYEELLGTPLGVTPVLDVDQNPNFYVLAERIGDDYVIRVGLGVVGAVQTLWNSALADQAFMDGIGTSFVGDEDQSVHVSLVWLMLHEMAHFDLNHFDLSGQMQTTRPHQFALVSRNPSLIDTFSDEHRRKVEPCLELQADHDAIELVLDAYSIDEWPSLRACIAAISAMMMLIEREDAKLEQDHSSHPKAATRIFQLLGHVMEMPMIYICLYASLVRTQW